MYCRHSLSALLLLSALAGPAAAQPAPVNDAADLFPPDALAYFEVVKPADVAREVTQFIKGTVMEDMNAFMAKWRDKQGDGYFPIHQMVGTFSAFAGPEAMAELARMQGGAMAITGIDKKGEPEIVGVILPGQSNVPGFITRMILTVAGSMRTAGQVEGVTILGDTPRFFNRIGPGGAPAAPMPPPKPGAPFIAQMPNAIVIGSSLENVSDVVRRIKGKEKRPALSGDAGFKDAAGLRARPGLFVYANPSRGLEVLEAFLKGSPDALPPMAQRALTEFLNPKAIRSASASLSLSGGTFDLRLAARVEPGKSSPLLDLIADQKAGLQLLQPVPKDATASFSLALQDGEKHFKRLLAAADTAVGDDGPRPSEFIKQLEEKLKVSIGKEIVARIAAITVALPAKQELPKGASEVPMLFITATDAAAAEQLEGLIAPFISALAGDTVEPVTETIQGVRIRALPAAGFPWKAPLNYGRQGATIALGCDRKLVAASLSGKIGDSLAGDALVAGALHGNAGAAVGVWRWSTMLPEALAELTNEPTWVNGKRQMPEPSKVREKIEKLRKSQADLMQKLPPLVVSLGREQGQVTVTVQQRHPAGTPGKLIEGLLNAIMSSATNIFDNAQFAPVAPVAPPPIKN